MVGRENLKDSMAVYSSPSSIPSRYVGSPDVLPPMFGEVAIEDQIEIEIALELSCRRW